MKLIKIGFRGCETKLKKIKKEKLVSGFMLSRMLSSTLMVFLMPISMVSTQANDNSKIEEAQSAKIETSIVLDTKTPNLLGVADDKPRIVPGESKTEKKIRLAREVEERKKAEEAKKVKLAEQAKRVVYASVSRVPDPTNFDQIYKQAQSIYGVDWRLLRAVHYIETGASGSTAKRSYAGAVGPMQFLPSTWRSYGVDGNGDGKADITNVVDAVHAAARYLKACGYPNVDRALWGYNPSYSYRYKIATVANSLGFHW